MNFETIMTVLAFAGWLALAYSVWGYEKSDLIPPLKHAGIPARVRII